MRILDTDTCIEILRGNTKVHRRRAETPDKVATTWINAAELFFGAARSAAPEANRAVVSDFLTSLEVLCLGEAAAQIFGESKAMLRQSGQGLADADLLIGAMALARDATLVTGNLRHYERIPGLLIENWIR